jgi:hypothetical protein
MNSDYIYEEKVFAKIIGGMLGAVTVMMVIILIWQVMFTSLDEVEWLPILFITMFFLFLFLTLTFSRLIIRVSFQGVTVSFGIIKKSIPWENIEGIEIDETSAIKYGGAGIRTARIKGEWVLVYNVIGGPRCALRLKEGRFKRFVFSTKNPEEVVNVIKGQMALTSH